jgi:hypothetical protein
LFALFSCAVLFLFSGLFFLVVPFSLCNIVDAWGLSTRLPPVEILARFGPGRMWIHEFSRFFNNRGLVEVEGQRGGTNFCCDVVGFTVFLRLGCLHVQVNGR